MWVRYLCPLIFPTPRHPGVGHTGDDVFWEAARDAVCLTSWGAKKKFIILQH